MNKIFFVFIIGFVCCNIKARLKTNQAQTTTSFTTINNKASFDSSIKTIHVLIALCDNKYQGIVPVPAKIGNGQDPDNNLYWGCSYGVRSYFKASKSWELVKKYKIDTLKLERIVFKHKAENWYLITDAYDGRYIKQCTVDFLKSCAGQYKDTVTVYNKTLGINGNAKLLAYIGHDGLMEFKLSEDFTNVDATKRDAIILACISKNYFTNYLKQTNANPLVWTTGLMSPEAYTLHDALNAYIKNEPAENIRSSAAAAYSRYQKCSLKAAKGLLVTGY